MNLPTPEPASPAGYLNNFQDPIGLARRMLCSRNQTAWWALAREVLRCGALPLDLLLARGDRRLLKQQRELTAPLILVVGPPRSGTTLLHQVLAATLDVCWFPNVSEVFPRAPLTATRWFGGRFRRTGGLQSFFGQTSGLTPPNDAFHIWNRWFGTDRYEPILTPQAAAEMRNFMACWTELFGKPLLNKNNRNTLCVGLLSRALPTAHFVIASRDAADVARSLVRSREFVQGSRSRPWGLASCADRQNQEHGYIDDVVDQIASIRARLSCEISQVAPERVTVASYEELCDDPCAIVENIASRANVALRPHPADLSALRQSATRPLDDAEERRLADCLLREKLTAAPAAPTPSHLS